MKLYFEDQVRLLLEVLGTIADNPYFVLKGGTAINFFHTNMPRLSVDIDLAYSKINSREEFLKENEIFWDTLSNNLLRRHKVLVQLQRTKEGIPKQLNIAAKNAEIKVEANLVLRGTIYPVIAKRTCTAIEKKYEIKIQLNTLSFEDLYAGKFCAALDRQHPRDLFDVMIFFKSYQVSEKLKKAFLIYLISHNRPIEELINPNRLNQIAFFDNEFAGMTNYEVLYRELAEARENLICALDTALNQRDREFLISFKQGEPLWDYLGIDHVKDMPAVKWKLHNIAQMDSKKYQTALNKLKKKLGF